MATTINHTRSTTSLAEAFPLLSTPADIFVETLSYLSNRDLKNVSSTCKALANNPFVKNAIHKEPFKSEEFVEHHYIGPATDDSQGADNKPCGTVRFRKFISTLAQESGCGRYVRSLAIPHFSSLRDFSLIELHCPNLQSLDMSHVGGTCSSEGFTWSELVRTCPTLFSRLRSLKVDCAAQIQRSGRTAQHMNARLRSRNSDGDGLTVLLRACAHLETLAIVGSTGFSWAETEHQVQISDAIAKGAGPRLRTLQLWNMAVCIRSLRRFLEPLADRVPNLQNIEMNFHKTLAFFTRSCEVEDYQKCREKDLESESVYSNTTRDLTQYLSEIRDIVQRGRWIIKPIDRHREVLHNPRSFYPLLNNERGIGLLRFMRHHLGWNPVFAWDALVSPASFSSYLPSDAPLAAKSPSDRETERDHLKALFQALHSMDLPVKILHSAVNNRSHRFFNDDEDSTLNSEDWCFTPLASYIDELRISYGETHPVLIRPGRAGAGTSTHWHGTLPGLSASLLTDDVVGFRPFWRNFASTFVRLGRLSVCVPEHLYSKWTDREILELLPDSSTGAWRSTLLQEGASSLPRIDRVQIAFSREERR
ncbi:MAG: hypothetical protein M1816_002721 [Peltula sp. TS41687]|nr:MAG: hypothetical protein M1816_002721 [Peltula sp. TS41687]